MRKNMLNEKSASLNFTGGIHFSKKHNHFCSYLQRYVADVLLDYDLQQESSSRCQAPCYGTIDRGATDMI